MLKKSISLLIPIILMGCSNTPKEEDISFDSEFNDSLVVQVTMPDNTIYLSTAMKQNNLKYVVFKSEENDQMTLKSPDYLIYMEYPKVIPAYPVQKMKDGKPFPESAYFISVASNENKTIIEFKSENCHTLERRYKSDTSSLFEGCNMKADLIKIK